CGAASGGLVQLATGAPSTPTGSWRRSIRTSTVPFSTCDIPPPARYIVNRLTISLPRQEPDDVTTTILFTGDSITDAGRRTDPSGRLGAGYVRRIAELLRERRLDATVVNTGI